MKDEGKNRGRDASNSRRIVFGALVALMIAGTIGLSVWRAKSSNDERLLLHAREALASGRYAEALDLSEQILVREPQSADALLIAGQCSRELHENGRLALQYFERVPDDSGVLAAQARFLAGDVQLEIGAVSVAEELYRQALAIQPDHVEAGEQLLLLLRLEGRNHEVAEVVRDQLLNTGRCPSEFLFAAGAPDRIWIDQADEELIRSIQSRPESEPLIELGIVNKSVLTAEDRAQAFAVTREVIRYRPDLVEAHARLGVLLMESGASEEIARWHSDLPSGADRHPRIWFVRGFAALGRGLQREAVRCFWEVVQRDPNHKSALYQLSQQLAAVGAVDESELIERRFSLVAELHDLIVHGEGAGGFPGNDVIQRIAERLVVLGRLWEASGWCVVALDNDPGSPWAGQMLDRLQSQLGSDMPLTISAADPALGVDLSRFPLPEWSMIFGVPGSADPQPSYAAGIRFEDDAGRAGLEFQFFNGARRDDDRAHMFEISGGGVGVLDYDNDGWPDIYLSQGTEWPVDPTAAIHHDCLFRNIGNGSFGNLTVAARLGDQGYGQGVSSGDIDGDGWDDIYASTIGGNRLYLNNGDGTYADALPMGESGHGVWTMSCLVADLNGDSLPDLYDVNYLGGDVFLKVCRDGATPIQCRPTMFPAESDRILVNSGDGRFEDATSTSGGDAPDGKGMGMTAVDLDGTGRLSLFIANDTTPNHLYRNVTGEFGSEPEFEEVATTMGVGFGEFGQAQACMGVAVGDVDRNGTLDLFVTNFAGQANNLFMQAGGLLFEDRIRSFGMFDAGLHSMGWGAQFLDANLDGYLDLIVANGHLEDYSSRGIPSRMNTQFFVNRAGQRFDQVTAQQAGPYFDQLHLGRAVARVDWNRDGLEDVCISHVDRPLSLLTNNSVGTGQYVVIRLRGTKSSRDAVGTSVWVRVAGREMMGQLTAGDGFQCSNERQIVFGLADSRTIDELRVCWPNGLEQRWSNVPANQTVLLIENQDALFRLP